MDYNKIQDENLQIKFDVEIALHLREFIRAFISKKYQNRWMHIIFEKPEKGKIEFSKFENHLNENYCKLLDTYPEINDFTFLNSFFIQKGIGIQQFVELTPGILYQPGFKPIKITFNEAMRKANWDSIFSIIPGKLAVFFYHEGWSWLCYKK